MKNIEIKKWKTSSGNMCFQFTGEKTFERAWLIILVTFLGVVTCCIDLFIWHSNFLFLILFLLILFLWATIPIDSVENVISKTVHEIMDKDIAEEANALGANVVKCVVTTDYKGTYGRIEAMRLLVLLDNDEIWEYPIIMHKQDNRCSYFECERNHIVSNNHKNTCGLSLNSINSFFNRLKVSEGARLGVLLFLILIIGCVVFMGLYWAFCSQMRWFLLTLLCTIPFYFLTEWLCLKIHSKFLNVVRHILYVQFLLIDICLQLTLPFLTIVGTYLFVFLFAFGVPTIILMVISHMEWFILKPEAIVYVAFAIGSIVCSNSYKAAKWIIRHSPLQDWGNHSFETYREKLAIYLIKPINITFLLYMIYFIILSISGYIQVENSSYLISKEFDTAILKAFLVFIAFTNMRGKATDTKVDTKELYQQTRKLFVREK